MPTIRHRTGSLAGQEQVIADDKERVVFGRDPQVCDVVFPADERLVARRHFALMRRLSGEWTVDLFGTPFVAVNGEPAEVGKAIRSGDRIELGQRGGPAFEITFDDLRLGHTLPLTAAQEAVPGRHAIARRTRNVALAGLALGLAAVAATGFLMLRTEADAHRLDRAVASLAEAQARSASESIGPDIRERLLAASYVVVQRDASGRERATGTATPVGPDLLGTNAHVVEIMGKLGTGGRLLVRAPGPAGRTWEVVEGRMHPAYEAFSTFRAEDPLFLGSIKECPTCLPTILSEQASYDVGLLRVSGSVPLEPILELATEKELAELKPGTPLAMAGYPLERIRGGEVQHLGATPTLSVGIVTALTDFFTLPAEPGQRKLVQHNLPGTGGNSGSPMVLPSGRIAAFHNSGTYIVVPNVGRVPNAAMIRYGQRADLLREMIEGRADEALARERAYWVRQTAAFQRGFDAIVPWILARQTPQKGASRVLATQSRHSLGAGSRFEAKDPAGKPVQRRRQLHAISLKAGRPVTFVAYGQSRAAMQVSLMIGDKVVARDEGTTWYPHLTHTPTQDATATLFVVSADHDVSYTYLEYFWDSPRS